MAKAPAKRTVRCYLCGTEMTVSPRALSAPCPGCNKAIKIEDIIIKSYTPVVDLQTCGTIRVTKRGRVAARRIQSGDGIVCEGVIEGPIETDGDVRLGPNASWKGTSLQSRSLHIAPGAKLMGVITVPWHRPETETRKPAAKKTRVKTARATTRTATTARTKKESPRRRGGRGN